jgi:flagellar hook-basal body complex protein FliE
MAITPITPITSMIPAISVERVVRLNNIVNEEQQPVEINKNFSFADMLKAMIDTVNESDAETKTDVYNLSMGFTDMQDLHNIEINAIRADLALRTVTSVRNKVLEAYSEVMRITI